MSDTLTRGRQADGESDRHWVVMEEDGSLSTVGRATDPTPAEIEAATAVLAAHDIGGWVAVQSGSLNRLPPNVMAVRRLGSPAKSFSDVVAALLASAAT